LALFLGERGVNVIAHSRHRGGTENVRQQLAHRGVRAESVEADLNSPEAIHEMTARIDALDVPVDLVFNNAGVQLGRADPFWTTSAEALLANYRVNAVAPTLIMCHFLPAMIARGFGRIVNTTSGIREQPEQAGYAASKAALDKLTTDVASQLDGSGVAANLVDPGWLRTDMGGSAAPGAAEDALPGVAAAGFTDAAVNGVLIQAHDFVGRSLEEAVAALEAAA
jgi:short-subunit dehydrogenase